MDNNGKGYGGYGTTMATTTTKEEKANPIKNRLDKEILSKEKDTATKEKAKDTRTSKGKGYNNKGQGKGHQDKKDMEKEKQQMIATDADNQDTRPNKVEWRSTTATLATSTSMTRQMTGTVRRTMTQMQQLALPQPADSSAVPISESQEVTSAMIGTAQQFTEDNQWVSLMIDSGAATPVCPPWFAAQFPLQHLEHGTGPQLRTVANQHIKLHGYRWVCVTNHNRQHIVIPFYAWWNKVSNLHWVTFQDYSAPKDPTAHWRTEMACSSYKQKSQHCQEEQSYRYTAHSNDRFA